MVFHTKNNNNDVANGKVKAGAQAFGLPYYSFFILGDRGQDTGYLWCTNTERVPETLL